MRKILSLLFIFVFAFALTACESNIENPNNKPNYEGSVEREEVLNYDVTKISEKLEKISAKEGILIELRITINDAYEKEQEIEKIIYGQFEKYFYFLADEDEIFIDLTNENKALIYTKDIEDLQWDYEEIIYQDAKVTLQEMEERCKSYTELLNRYLGNYDQFFGEKMQKISNKILNRDCDTYTHKLKLLNYEVEYTFSIDKETGACLKWEINSNNHNSEIGSLTFECVKFETPYALTPPTNIKNK